MCRLRFDNGGYLKEILQSLTIETSVNWWITDLVCYDYCGWPECEKWSETELFLTDEQFKHDVYTRNSQMVWGVFSTIPATYTQEEIEAYPHPLADGYWPKEMNKTINERWILPFTGAVSLNGWLKKPAKIKNPTPGDDRYRKE